MSTDTLKPLLDDIVKDEIRAIVRAEMSRYNLESLGRLIEHAESYSKKQSDPLAAIERFKKVMG